MQRVAWHWYAFDGEHILTDGNSRMLACIKEHPQFTHSHLIVEIYQNDDNLNPIGEVVYLKGTALDFIQKRTESMVVCCLWQ